VAVASRDEPAEAGSAAMGSALTDPAAMGSAFSDPAVMGSVLTDPVAMGSVLTDPAAMGSALGGVVAIGSAPTDPAKTGVAVAGSGVVGSSATGSTGSLAAGPAPSAAMGGVSAKGVDGDDHDVTVGGSVASMLVVTGSVPAVDPVRRTFVASSGGLEPAVAAGSSTAPHQLQETASGLRIAPHTTQVAPFTPCTMPPPSDRVGVRSASGFTVPYRRQMGHPRRRCRQSEINPKW
jgi:hypothetical protein